MEMDECLRCNSCFLSQDKNKNSPFSLTACGHIFCRKCLGPGKKNINELIYFKDCKKRLFLINMLLSDKNPNFIIVCQPNLYFTFISTI